MKRLETTLTKGESFFSRARRVVTTNVNSLSTWTKMLSNVGYVIIMVAILGVLLEGMVLIANFRSGKQYRADRILKDLLTSLWIEALRKTKQKSNSR